MALLLFLWGLRGVKSRVGAFAMFAAWARYILTFYHEYTFRQVAAGLTGNALGSVFIVGFGLLAVRKKHLLFTFFWPIYAMMGVIVLSGLLNGEVGGMITALTKHLYLVVFAVAVYEALGKTGPRPFFPAMLWAVSPLIVFQVVSLALGVVKPGEVDGADSYIGGYSHEAAFSIALATALLLTCLATSLSAITAGSIVLVVLVGILLANYRTTVLAMAPLVFAYFGLPRLKQLNAGQRPLVWVITSASALILLLLGAFIMQDRMADIGNALSQIDNLLKRPEAYTPEDKRILSGRPYIWSNFIYGYLEGSDVQRVIGIGPETWEALYKTYPHNTLVSYLYEYGVVGVCVTLFLWAWMTCQAFQARAERRAVLVGAHISWVLLNMATMPHWIIEGNALYAILCGCTLYERRVRELAEWRVSRSLTSHSSGIPLLGEQAAARFRLDQSLG